MSSSTSHFLSSLVLLAGLSLSPRASAAVQRHALVVGNNAAAEQLSPLLYAEDDARRVADLLIELGGFDSDAVTVLDSPTHDQLLAAIEVHRSLAAAEPEDLFLFYYSGHADQRGLRLGLGEISFDELREAIRSVPAEVRLGILDACRSGEITRIKGLSVAEPFMDEEDLSAEGEAWLTAASADEAAQESDLLQGSFFTHYLLSGLRGAADSGDGVVSLDEAYTYAYDRTVARTGGTLGGTQHPAYDFRIQGKGDLPLTDVRRASARLHLQADLAGVITILREPDDSPVAEVAKAAGTETVLALPAGSYRLLLRADGQTQEGHLGLSDGADLVVPALAFAQLDGAVALKGSDASGSDASGSDASGSGFSGSDASGSGFSGTAPVPTGWTPVRPAEDDASGAGGFRPNRVLGRLAERTGEAILSAGARLQGSGASTDSDSEVETQTQAQPEEQTQPADPGAAPASSDAPVSGELDLSGAELNSATQIDHRNAVDLRHSPVIAAAASALLPGAGQAYNGQWLKGGGFLVGWAAIAGTSLSTRDSTLMTKGGWGGALFTAPTPGLMLAQLVRGWATADAWQFHKAEEHRPVTGVTLTYSSGWQKLSSSTPAVGQDLGLTGTGLAVDWVMEPGFSLGLDRTGFVRRQDGSVLVDTGVRMIFGFWERGPVRPGLFVYGGLGVDSSQSGPSVLSGQAGGGANLRTYLTPRYFVELETRGGLQDGAVAWSTGAGLGVHLGRPGQGRPKSRSERQAERQDEDSLEKVDAASQQLD